MTADYYQQKIEELLPEGYSFEIVGIKKNGFLKQDVRIYRNGSLILGTKQETLEQVLNYLLIYLEGLK